MQIDLFSFFRKALWALPLFSPLFATVNEPLRIELLSGYRNDRVHWHLQESGDGGALTYSELYRDVEFWVNGLTLKTIHRDLVFCLGGDYATFGSGGISQRYADLSFTNSQPHFHFNSHGWAADGSGYFGYAVNLTQDRIYKVILIPLIGYSAHFERLRGRGASPNPLTSISAINATSFTMQSSLPNQMHLTWYGFFFGGEFYVQPGGRLNFLAGYSYHLLNLRFKSHFKNEVSLFNPALISQEISQTKVKANNSGIGQSGWILFDYLLTQHWKCGLGAQVHYFSSQVITAKETITTIPLVPAASEATSDAEEKFKMRWTSISGWVQVSREF